MSPGVRLQATSLKLGALSELETLELWNNKLAGEGVLCSQAKLALLYDNMCPAHDYTGFIHLMKRNISTSS